MPNPNTAKTHRPKYKVIVKQKDKYVSHYDLQTEWHLGFTNAVDPPVYHCIGLNCCSYIQDAMKFVTGDVLVEVIPSGKIIEDHGWIPKWTCEQLTVTRMWRMPKIAETIDFIWTNIRGPDSRINRHKTLKAMICTPENEIKRTP